MATTQTSALSLKINADLSSVLDLVTAKANIDKKYSFSLASGSGADQADDIFSDTRTLSASGTEDHDLAGGLTNAFGETLTFSIIKAMIFSAAAANTNDVQVSVKSANGFVTWALAASDGITLRPGGMFCIVNPDATGMAVTASTGDLLTVTNSSSGTSVTYDMIIIGVKV
jgi:hypothetical protein